MSDLPGPERAHAPTTRSRHRRRALLIGVLAVAALTIVTVGAFAVWFITSGGPVADEWQCSTGEAPYTFDAGGGSDCWPEDKPLPPGGTWDPLGNRPLDCEDRDGWTQIENAHDIDPEADCLRNGLPMPQGWRAVAQ